MPVSIEICPACTCRFAVGLFRCPQCQTVAPLFAGRVREETELVPRITVAEGPTNPGALPGEPGYVLVSERGPNLIDAPVGNIVLPPEGSDDLSAGISFSTSDGKPDSSSSGTPTSSAPPAPAPTTENLSSPDPLPMPESGGAGSTDGSGLVTGSVPSRRRVSSTGSRKDRGRTPDSPNSVEG